MITKTDAALVEEAYREIHDRLWRSLLAFTGNPEVASDAEAEAFSQVLRRGDQVHDIVRWVWRAAFRIAAGMLQAERRHASTLQSPSRCEESELSGLKELLSGLSIQQQACVVLRHVADYDTRTIAGLLRTTPTVVRVQLHRAHSKLRSRLEGMDE